MRHAYLLMGLMVVGLASGCGDSCDDENPVGPETQPVPTLQPTPVPPAAQAVPFLQSFASDTENWVSSNSNALTVSFDATQGQSAPGSLKLSSPGNNADAAAKAYRAIDTSASIEPNSGNTSFYLNLDSVDPSSPTNPTVIEFFESGLSRWRLEVLGSGPSATWTFNGEVINCSACPASGFIYVQVVHDSGNGVLQLQIGAGNYPTYNNVDMGGLAVSYPVSTGLGLYGGDGLHNGGAVYIDDIDSQTFNGW